jgi:hypothetical protein
MAGLIPATGQAISFGGVYNAFVNGSSTAPAAGTNIKLSQVLGVNYGGKTLGAEISISSTFGGKTTPYPYYPGI